MPEVEILFTDKEVEGSLEIFWNELQEYAPRDISLDLFILNLAVPFYAYSYKTNVLLKFISLTGIV